MRFPSQADVLAAAGGGWPLAWCLAVVLVAYALRGATGFGAGVVSIPLLLLALPLSVVIPLVTGLGLVASFGQVIHQRRHVDRAALTRLIAPTLVGLALGLWLFAALDDRLLQRALALFIIGYALWGLLPWKSGRPAPVWLGALTAATGGFVATVFGGMAGPFYVVYLRVFQLDKTRFRATIAFALLCLAALRAAGYGSLGFYDTQVLLLFLALLPAVGVAMVIGERWFKRLDELRFARVVAGLLALAGLALLFK